MKTEKEGRASYQRETNVFFFFLARTFYSLYRNKDIFLMELISNASDVRLCFVNHILIYNYYYDLILIMQNRYVFQFQALYKIGSFLLHERRFWVREITPSLTSRSVIWPHTKLIKIMKHWIIASLVSSFKITFW